MSDDGFVDKVKGNAKEGVGKLTRDKDLEAEGKADQAEGAVKETIADVKAGVQAAADKVKEAFNKDN